MALIDSGSSRTIVGDERIKIVQCLDLPIKKAKERLPNLHREWADGRDKGRSGSIINFRRPLNSNFSGKLLFACYRI